MDYRNLGLGTGFKLSRGGFAQVIGGRAMCADGKVRALAHVGEPDTVWTRPAAVKVKGRYVAGYVTIESAEGSDVPLDHDPAVLKFCANVDVRAAVFPGLDATWKRPAADA